MIQQALARLLDGHDLSRDEARLVETLSQPVAAELTMKYVESAFMIPGASREEPFHSVPICLLTFV